MPNETMTHPSPDADREQRLESILADYIRACESGSPPDRRQILERHPELADDLRQFFGQRDRMNQLAAPFRQADDAEPPTVGPGKQLSYVGNYELLAEVARGGMGIVYKARQTTLGRIVAVKMIIAGRLATDDDVRRFHIEAQAAAGLKHPHIVSIHEVGQHEGWHYFSMDYVEGRDLSAILRENLLPAKQAATYVRQMAEAIHYAHQQGTLHRDVKPSNVLIDQHDQIHITDFGLAMRVEGGSDLTKTGQIVGTPSYMPPEQAQGKRSLIGSGSDVYSLGAVLYECLTGRPPFRAESVIETIQQVIHTEPAAPRLLNPVVPRDLETICLKCLEKEPHRRYGSAKQLADDLGHFLRGEPISARPISRPARLARWCRRNPLVAALTGAAVALLLVIASGTTVAYLREANLHGRAERLRGEIQQAHGDVTQLRSAERQLRTLIGSAEQQLQQAQQRTTSLETDFGELETQRQSLATVLESRQQKLYSTLLYLAQADWEAGEVFRADGYLNDCPPHLRDRHWERLKKLCRPHVRTFAGTRCLAISPNGHWLATMRKRVPEPAPGTRKPGVLPLESPANELRPSRGTGAEIHITFVNRTPGEIKLVWMDMKYQRHSDRSIPANESYRQHTYAGHVWLVTDARGRHFGVVAAVADGKVIVEGEAKEPWEILVWDLRTEQLVRVIPSWTPVRVLAFCPDNRTLISGGSDAVVQLWDAASGELRHSLAEHTAPVTCLSLSTDGRRLATASFRQHANGSEGEILLWDLDRMAVMRKLTGMGTVAIDPSGQRVAFQTTDIRSTHGRPTTYSVVRCEPCIAGENATGDVFQIDNRSINDGHGKSVYTFSPQGTHLAIAGTNSTDDRDIEIWNVAEKRRLFQFHVFRSHVAHLAYSRDGTRVAYSVGSAIVVRSLHTGERERTLPWYESPITGVAFSPDGLSLATVDEQNVKVWDVTPAADPTEEILADIRQMKVGPRDWPQWGGSRARVNTPAGKRIPSTWDLGTVNPETGKHQGATRNVKWIADLGSHGYGNPVVANGKIFVGTNNGNGYLKRYPNKVDLGVLLCFDEQTGKFLWQHSNEKLPTGRVHDWDQIGVCSTPTVDGDRLWYVTNRGEVVCLDTEGFADGEDDGEKAGYGRMFEFPADEKQIATLGNGTLPVEFREAFGKAGTALPDDVIITTDDPGKQWSFTATVNNAERQFRITGRGPNISGFRLIAPNDKDEADVVWKFDMMKELGVLQHNMANCSPLIVGDRLFVCTSNGVDESHKNVPAPDAPSFIALDRWTGKLLWTDKSPGANIQHAQWASPSYGVFAGQPQVIFPGGDGWIYSFDPAGDGHGNSKLLWKFDGNFKESKYIIGGRGTRNEIIAFPAIYDGLVYIVMGMDPEHGEGPGCLWCLDPAKHRDGADVSESLAVDRDGRPIPYKPIQAVDLALGERSIANPQSAVVWRYTNQDRNGDGKTDFEEEFHRSIAVPVIKDDILYVTDFSGLFHCLNAKTGKVYWTYDLLAACWGSALLVDGKVFMGDEDGDLAIFRHSSDPAKAMRDGEPWFGATNMGSSIYMTPIVANNVLYITTKNKLFALVEE